VRTSCKRFKEKLLPLIKDGFKVEAGTDGEAGASAKR
jgi:hypothetical protein